MQVTRITALAKARVEERRAALFGSQAPAIAIEGGRGPFCAFDGVPFSIPKADIGPAGQGEGFLEDNFPLKGHALVFGRVSSR